MRKIVLIMAAAVMVASLAAPAMAANLGVHDTVAGVNPCKECHDTASGSAAVRGWAGAIPASASTWAKNVSILCYYCHSAGNTVGATIQAGNAYNDNNHSFPIGNAPEEPEGTTETTIGGLTLPYVTTGNLECTSCHNVHVFTNRPFNQRATIQTLCDECHPGRIGPAANVGTANTQGGTARAYSTHPTGMALAEAGTTAAASIRAAYDGVFATTIAGTGDTGSPGWALGGHLDGATGDAGNMTCQTCHTVHGAVQGSAVSFDHYLALQNTTAPTSVQPSALCEGCHNGGEVNAGTAVGSLGPLVAPDFSDHPLDNQNNRTFYPAGVSIPGMPGNIAGIDWSPGAANTNNDGGAQGFYGAAGVATPVCSSCHDAHGAIPGSSILRGVSATSAGAPVWTFTYDEWCFVCHLADQVIPNNHHSVVNNWAPSQLSCGDCHGATANGVDWTAHNGFWTWEATAPPAIGDSLFCLGCHIVDDPLAVDTTGLKNVAGSLATPIATPSQHGNAAGSGTGSSHQIGIPEDVVGTPLNPQNYAGWIAGPDFSDWGAEAATPTNPGRVAEGFGNPGELLCESCHNILFNGVADSVQPGAQDLTGGWEANLLMGTYEDDPIGVDTGDGGAANDYYTYPEGAANPARGAGDSGVELCRKCHRQAVGAGVWDVFVHNPPAHTLNMIGFDYTIPIPPSTDPNVTPYGRATATVETDGACPDGTTADAAGAPGTFSYPAIDQVNCDSCHRPHSADPLSDDGAGRWLILEDAGGGDYGTTVCLQCHDTDTQCN